jgi:RsiW-degrading membrane proteinase PrsW (M82 family)
MPDAATSDRARRVTGLILWIVAVAAGIVLNILFQLVEIFESKNPARMFDAVATGATFALIPLVIYLFIPAVLDRYDPEPWWCLGMVFLWGALVATGFAALINSSVDVAVTQAIGGKSGREAGTLVTSVISAPLCEELFKGLAVFGVFFFLRREFDGIVDGIIYATFCALGFAAIENVSYYARAEAHNHTQLLMTFGLRGILAPWGHPLYTSMTGIGFGLARESTSTAVRWLAPLGGYLFGVFLHAVWNFVPTVFGEMFIYMLPLWFVFVFGFACMILVLVVRKGRIIRSHLRDEVLLGNLSREEVDLICSPVGRLRCAFSWRGATGRAFIGAGARLALSKWHTARAMRGQKRTMSTEFIIPLRHELARLRARLATQMPR